MGIKIIQLDLDGTLTDSGEGIMNCAELALRHFGLPVPDREAMRVFVGPPLAKTFVEFGVAPDKTDEAIAVYRSRYTTVGKWENAPYPGVEQLLCKLTQAGCRLFVATSKPEDMSIEILEKFGLAKYFEKICGATLDGTRGKKEEVIAYLLKTTDLPAGITMVGDTVYDVEGAAFHQIPCIGVSWGYGKVADMEAAGAKAIAYSMEELYQLAIGSAEGCM